MTKIAGSDPLVRGSRSVPKCRGSGTLAKAFVNERQGQLSFKVPCILMAQNNNVKETRNSLNSLSC